LKDGDACSADVGSVVVVLNENDLQANWSKPQNSKSTMEIDVTLGAVPTLAPEPQSAES